MKNLIIQCIACCFICHPTNAQRVQMLATRDSTSIRGLSVVTDKIIWVSGNHGTVGRSLDTGKTWKWLKVKGFENRDFRDIEAFGAKTAVVMAIGEPAHLLKTTDGGESWKIVYENKVPGMFLDAMEFWNEQSGIVVGDPVNKKFFIARTFDGGNTWREINPRNLPDAESGEACFAASGTNIRKLDRDEACFVTGGKTSRFFSKYEPILLPVIQGKESTGANSLAIRDDKKLRGSMYFVVVGGDYRNDTLSEKNCFISDDGGKKWLPPAEPPHGYRSCVEFISKEKVVACGTSGVDVSTDAGNHWKLVSRDGFHVCRKAKKGKAVFLAGANGIARLVE